MFKVVLKFTGIFTLEALMSPFLKKLLLVGKGGGAAGGASAGSSTTFRPVDRVGPQDTAKAMVKIKHKIRMVIYRY